MSEITLNKTTATAKYVSMDNLAYYHRGIQTNFVDNERFDTEIHDVRKEIGDDIKENQTQLVSHLNKIDSSLGKLNHSLNAHVDLQDTYTRDIMCELESVHNEIKSIDNLIQIQIDDYVNMVNRLKGGYLFAAIAYFILLMINIFGFFIF